MHLVFLHGRAAAGKLTTARHLSALVGYPVFHNHLVVDLLTTVFPFGSEPFVRLREQFWLAAFTEAARPGRSLIFTFTPRPHRRGRVPGPGQGRGRIRRRHGVLRAAACERYGAGAARG